MDFEGYRHVRNLTATNDAVEKGSPASGRQRFPKGVLPAPRTSGTMTKCCILNGLGKRGIGSV